MNYFVNENIFTLNSGTEFSAIQRLKLFKANQVEAKILTRNYNPQLSGDLVRVGLNQDDVLNMYDYFQEITHVEEHDVNVRYTEAIDKRVYHIDGVDANESLIKHAGRRIGKVSIAPETVGLVGSMEYYDDMNNLITKDIWDRRGFKSSIQYFHPGGVVGPQVFVNLDGVPKIEITHMNINGNLFPTMYKLLNYKGKDYRFNTEEELFTFFLNEISALSPSVFINDRPSLIPAVAKIQGAVGKWQFLHNAHSKNNTQVGASRQIEDYLRDLFTQYNQNFDGLIVSTEQQKNEIAKYFEFKKIFALPDSHTEKGSVVNEKVRNKNKIAFLGRIANEKNPMDIIEIFDAVHQSFPNVTLDFYGYISPASLQKELDDFIDRKGIKDAVNFCGYLKPEALDAALNQASVLVSTTSSEGGAMTILEALNHGIPVVAYKVKYGVSELIDDGKNGYLVPFASKQGIVDALAKILQSGKQWNTFSKAAYEKAEMYNASSAWEKWLNQKVIAENLFVSKNGKK